jgi:hypothetical protein
MKLLPWTRLQATICLVNLRISFLFWIPVSLLVLPLSAFAAGPAPGFAGLQQGGGSTNDAGKSVALDRMGMFM